jgi:hypothetical protein
MPLMVSVLHPPPWKRAGGMLTAFSTMPTPGDCTGTCVVTHYHVMQYDCVYYYILMYAYE